MKFSNIKSDKQLWATLGVFIAILGSAFFLVPYSEGYLGGDRTLYQRVREFWSGYSDWEHCALVPFICGFLVWRCRKKLSDATVVPSYRGWPVLLVAAFSYWFGAVGDQHYAGFFAIQILIAGLIICFWGREIMEILFFPWAFLFFMWPLLFLENIVAFPLRILMSQVSYYFLNFIGVDVVLRGTGLLSAADPMKGLASGEIFSVDIANPCSGIRSLFALMMVSALFAYFTLKPVTYPWMSRVRDIPVIGEVVYPFLRNWKCWLLFFCSLPLAVAGNFFRIMMLTFGTMWFGSEFAIGSMEEPSTFHMVSGFFVFIIALGGMVGVSWLLERDWSREMKWMENALKRSGVRRE